MGKLFLIMGKSATGKDHVYRAVLDKCSDLLCPVVPYTTRPMRDGETEGVEYHFKTIAELEELKKMGKVVESRVYHTVYGDWYYFTCDDGQIDLANKNSILIVTPEAYGQILNYFGKEMVVPVYIEIDDKTRLERAMSREAKQEKPKYAEMCRRFLADEQDFSEDVLLGYGITRRFINDDFDTCVQEIVDFVRGE